MQKGDSHLRQIGVDVRIMNDLTNQKESAIWEFCPCLVCVVHGAIDAVAESEFLSEMKGESADREAIAVRAHRFDNRTVIVGRALPFEFRLEAKSAAEVGGFHQRKIRLRCTLSPSS